MSSLVHTQSYISLLSATSLLLNLFGAFCPVLVWLAGGNNFLFCLSHPSSHPDSPLTALFWRVCVGGVLAFPWVMCWDFPEFRTLDSLLAFTNILLGLDVWGQ